MANNKQVSGSIHVFGLGVRAVMQITLEANYMLQEMEQVFHGEEDAEVSRYIASIGCEEVSVRHLYAEGKPREQAYQEICDTIVEAAQGGKKTAYLTPGNPAFLNSVVFRLRDATARLGIPFFIYSGVSSIDTLITDLFIPVEATGLQCFEATHFVRMRPRIDKRVPLLLFQPSVVEAFEVRHRTGVYLPGVEILQAVLIETYPADQKWILFRSALAKDDTAIVATGVLSELVQKATYLELGTLLILGEWGEIGR